MLITCNIAEALSSIVLDNGTKFRPLPPSEDDARLKLWALFKWANNT